jgi:hypothetical protein
LIRLRFAGLHIAQPAGFVRIPRGVVMVGAGSGSLVPSQRVERSGDSLEVNLVAAAAAAAFTNIKVEGRRAAASHSDDGRAESIYIAAVEERARSESETCWQSEC